ncbi:hypothetical protein [Proteus hauseri]|uniref:hypothetical protein n=1 Tax=Proteus hauseri TaxID=183417 RepID=UPI0032DB69E2
MEKITLQAFINQEWRDIAIIHFPDHDRALYASKYDITYPITELVYEADYAIDYLFRDDHYAVSLNHPVELYFDDYGSPGWLKFLDDIVPSGASRRYWIQYLDLAGLTVEQQNYKLLRSGTISPIGNLRVKESLPEPPALKETALQLLTLKERLKVRGVPEQILTMPTFGFDFIPNKLERWGILS